MFKAAGKAEIVRSHQKDDYYLTYLRGLAADVIHDVIGPRQWIRWRKEVDIVSDLGYFLLTTFSGYQTIGEEYVNIIQVDQSKRRIPSVMYNDPEVIRSGMSPSVMTRGIMVCLHILTPYCLRKLLEWLDMKLRSPDSHEIPMETREFLMKCIPIARTYILYCHRIHMAMFYLRGIYYYIAKRTLGVHYIQMDRGLPSTDESVSQSFRVLGWLTMAQLVGSVLLATYKVIRDRSKVIANKLTSTAESSTISGYVSADRKCSLCLEERKQSTATPCGHLFCWTCIHDWCSSKSECPLCREKFEQHRIVYLQNMDPT